MDTKFSRVLILLLGLLFFVRPANAISLGQLDDFQDGTPMGWQNGGQVGSTPVTNVAGGGPAGASDSYIRVTADGVGAGGRLVAFNFQQWTGDYVAQGVTAIELDLRNQGSVSLSIRLAFQIDTTQSAPGYLSIPMLLAPGSGWQHFSIALTPAMFTAVGSPGPFNNFISTPGPGWLRIIHQVGTSGLNGDIVVAQLGIDNIHAIPEPTTMALVAGSLLLFALAMLKGKRRSARE